MNLIITFYVAVFCFPDIHVISPSYFEMDDFHVFTLNSQIVKSGKLTSSGFSNSYFKY